MIVLVSGPPFNRSLDEIGWLTRTQIQRLFLSYRNLETGKLDLDMLQAEERAQKRHPDADLDPYAAYREIRRQQAVPEYLIDKEIREARKRDG